MNILLTSVGRRSYLVQYFKEALNGEGQVHVMNSSDLSPAFNVADKSAVSPLIYDADYIPFLLKYCKENKIKAIISLFDIDLPILSKNKDKFEEIGTKVIVADEWVIDTCNDKWNTYQFLLKNEFNAPATFVTLESAIEAINKGEVEYPLMVKPRWGMGSIAVYEADNETELKVFYDKTKREIAKTYLKYESEADIETSVLIQEKLKGQEYGLDIINDLDGKYQNTVPKMKYAMRSGETDCAVTVGNNELKEMGKKLSSICKHPGNLDVDVFVTEDKNYVLEMNARFGGGYPFSHMAGVNLPKAIVQWLNEEPIEEGTLTERVNIMYQKDIGLTRLKLKPDTKIVEVTGEEEVTEAVVALEYNLVPTLSDRSIDINNYARKIFKYGQSWVVLNKEDKSVGILAAYMNDQESKTAYLTMLALDSSYRGLGLAEKLLILAEKKAEKLGMKSFKLEVHKNNHSAIGFYKKCGYNICDEETADSYYMIKKLS